MSHKITGMNTGQGFAANLSTGILVILASLIGFHDARFSRFTFRYRDGNAPGKHPCRQRDFVVVGADDAVRGAYEWIDLWSGAPLMKRRVKQQDPAI